MDSWTTASGQHGPPPLWGLVAGETDHLGLDSEGRTGDGVGRSPVHGGVERAGTGEEPRERLRPRTDPRPPRRTGITPTSTASTTAPWPCAWSCCCPRSTRRPGAPGRRPSWTAPRCAAPASDRAPQPAAAPPASCPSPPALPQPGCPGETPPSRCGRAQGFREHLYGEHFLRPPYDVSTGCRAPRRKEKFLPPAGHSGRVCGPPEPHLSVSPSPHLLPRKSQTDPDHQGALVSSPCHLFGNWHRRFCPVSPGSERDHLGSWSQQGRLCPQPGPSCPRPPLWLGL